MTFYAACLLFMSFAKNSESKVIASRAPSVAWAAIAAFQDRGPIFEDDADGTKTIALLVRVAYLESRGDAWAYNVDGDAGITQLRRFWWQGHRREEIVGDAVLDFSLTIDAFRALKATCGGKAQRWIGAFASGVCGGAPFTARIRCAPVGLCTEG